MKVCAINGQNYRLPSRQNIFQRDLYVHLINWKWEHVTRQVGTYRGQEYDAILPADYTEQLPVLYPDIRDAFRDHLAKFPFRIHRHFNHMASSQAANVNLFLPILLHRNANAILTAVNPEFARIATDQLDNGYRIEFWDEPFGNLGDKTKVSGTDADLAIAYYNHNDELCLWLIEHKLTESNFTKCGGFSSRGRKAQHDCSRSFSDILANKSLCYYHDVRHFNYWNITDANQDFFTNHTRHAHCPFQGGMNQLWRNQLLALGVEQDARQPFKHVMFSVVRHPGNHYLDRSLKAYRDLIGHNPKFSVFTSVDILNAASQVNDSELGHWIEWYVDLYNLPVERGIS